jgi:hypothetical protein
MPLSLASVFVHAAPVNQVTVVLLLAASLAAVIVGGRKLAAGPHRAGGSAFLSALRFGGPLAGLAGAAWTATRAWLGIANVAAAPTLHILAPALAEGTMLLAAGLLAGAVAIAANWAVEARLDRAVLGA